MAKKRKLVSRRDTELCRGIIKDVLFELRRPLDPDYIGRKIRAQIYEQLERLTEVSERLKGGR